MDFHYNKHHKTYVDTFNNLTGQAQEAMEKGDLEKYASFSKGIKFNAGGHFNHQFFWESLAPTKQGGGARPDSNTELAKMINQQWGSIDNFITHFNATTATIQGSGWGWLVYNKKTKALEYRSTPNQDMLSEVQSDLSPILNIDLWEHAYYLDYKNVKVDFLKEIWKVVNWNQMEKRLKEVKSA